jgi:hypothetical protein
VVIAKSCKSFAFLVKIIPPRPQPASPAKADGLKKHALDSKAIPNSFFIETSLYSIKK